MRGFPLVPMKPLSYFLLVASICLLPSMASAVGDATVADLEEKIDRAVNEVNRSLLRIQNHPCSMVRGLQRSLCIMETHKGALPTGPAVEAPVDRRRAALEQRALQRESIVIPRTLLTPGRVDLRPTDERRAEKAKRVQGILKEQREQGISSAPSSPKAFLQSRANAISRKNIRSTPPPLCVRRHGMELLQCLKDMGVHVTPQTVDEPTWHLYQGR